MVMFKMRESVRSPRYSPDCNVLRQWKTSLIPTFRVYRLYDDLLKKIRYSNFVELKITHLNNSSWVYTVYIDIKTTINIYFYNNLLNTVYNIISEERKVKFSNFFLI